MSWYAVAALDDAFDATKSLLTPLDAGQWLRLALVAFFLGNVGGGGPSATAGSSTPGPSVALPDGSSGPLADLLSMEAGRLLPVAVAVASVALAVGLAYALVGSVMEFVFVESLRRRRVRIARYADQHRWRALGLFGFRLALGLAVVVPATAVSAAAVAAVVSGTVVPLALVVASVPVVVGLLAVAVAVDAFTTGFVVPVMVRTNRGVVGAWRLFWPTLTGQWQQFGVYALVRAGLGVVIGALASVVGGVVGAVVLAPLVALGALSALGLADPVAVLSNPVGLALAVLAGLSYVVVLTAATAVAFVPVRAFVRYHALFVLGEAEPRFDLLPDLRRELRERS